MERKTIVQLLEEAWDAVDVQRRMGGHGSAGREFALAATAIEDAIMRVNRGMTLAVGGALAPADVELSSRSAV
jgi:hypothetical protein